MNRLSSVVLAVLLIAPALQPLRAQQADSSALADLRQQVDALSRELERLQLGRSAPVTTDTLDSALAPAASGVYRTPSGVSLGGYGEFLYQHVAGADQSGTATDQADLADALRAVLYVGYRFDERWLINTELEFEHASTEDGGEAAVEFGYLEFRPSQAFGARAGLLLAPMGFVNEQHEPTTYLGATRPLTETFIIPSTWRENGLGVIGTRGALSYRAYLLAGFNGVEGYSADQGLRDGKQEGAKSRAETAGLVGRVDVEVMPGALLGASGYVGNAGQGARDALGSIAARTTIVEGHGQYRARGLDLRALVAVAKVGDAARINAVRGLAGDASVGSRLLGWYVQGGYDLLHGRRTAMSLVPYVRYEQVNTQAQVPDGFTADPANDRTAISLGARWKPLEMIAVKGEYQLNRTAARTGVDRLNVNFGYLF